MLHDKGASKRQFLASCAINVLLALGQQLDEAYGLGPP